MGTVLVAAAPHAGLSTFLGLLYATMVRQGASVEAPLRFHARRGGLDMVQSAYEELMDGRFPTQACDDRHLDLVLSLRTGPRGWSGWRTAPVHVGTLPLDDLAILLSSHTVIDERTRSWLACDAFVVLVDATTLVPGSGHAATTAHLAQALEAIVRWRTLLKGPRAAPLDLLMVLTKFDSRGDLPSSPGPLSTVPPPVSQQDRRREFANGLCQPSLGPALQVVARLAYHDRSVRPPAWFFSGLARAPPSSDRPVLRRGTLATGWEPDYGREEYEALLAHLGRVLPAGGNETELPTP